MEQNGGDHTRSRKEIPTISNCIIILLDESLLTCYHLSQGLRKKKGKKIGVFFRRSSMATLTTPQQRAQLRRPNILITGTPGTGKTSTASHIAVSLWVAVCRLLGRLMVSNVMDDDWMS